MVIASRRRRLAAAQPGHRARHGLLAAVALLARPNLAQNVAIANINPAGTFSGISGSVTFTQDASDPLADVTVTLNLAGLTPGTHGFHVHQYGDTRDTSDLSTMGVHFVPQCLPPELDPDTGEMAGGCEDDQVHGLPPSETRQPGDMGNIEVDSTGAVSTTLTMGQSKMSLTDEARSILGRVVVVHQSPDDGTAPYGNAGNPEAYGVIGMGGDAGNAALAPTIPRVDKVICTFEGDISGFALLTWHSVSDPDNVIMEAVMSGTGLDASSEHSFHFHTSGDMTVDWTAAGSLGDIYYSGSIDTSTISVDSAGTAQFYATYDVAGQEEPLLQHVGRSLTLHAGPTSASETIAAAACGLANPTASFDTSGLAARASVSEEEDDDGGVGVAALVVAVLGISLGILFLTVALLYYFHLPIPLCGRCLYGPDGHKPPPPPKYTTTQGTELPEQAHPASAEAV